MQKLKTISNNLIVSDKATINIDGASYDFPVYRGVEDDVCIDIKTLRGSSGVTTIDRGFKNTASCESKITYLDGEKGVLRYRGYDLDELANKASFLEVAFLLIFGELPTKKELEKFHDDIVDNSIVNDDVKKIVDAFPSSAHPMGVLSSLTSALTAFNPDDVSLDYDRSKEGMYDTIVKVLGKIPILVGWSYRKQNGFPLQYSMKLRNLDYTGSVEKFYATENETGEEVELSAENYVLFKKLKEYSNFRTEMTESKLPEIIKNIALIYVQQKRNDLAIGAIKDAREVNPLDVGLILTEANLYIQLGDKKKFVDLMKEAIDKDPNNHILYFNLGVITAEQGDRIKARSYYENAIELDPTYSASYLNLAALILDGEKDLVDKMNALGNSRADNIKYEQLQKQREDLFLEAVPILQKLTEIDPSNVDAFNTLKNIFGTIGDAANFKKMKEKLEALGQ